MSVQLEIERFRLALSQTSLSGQDIQNVIDALNGDINEAILDVVSSMTGEAMDYAIDIGAGDFIDDIIVLSDSNGFYAISTHSGITNYSTQSQEMLPHLLKNADISKDGHKYKVIPIQKKENQVQNSMFSMLQAKQDAADDARAALKKRAMDKRNGLTSVIRENISKQASIAHTFKKLSNVKTGETEFRTASDKQDTHISWVIPGKSADMTDYLSDVNRRIVDMSSNMLEQIIVSYKDMYMGL